MAERYPLSQPRYVSEPNVDLKCLVCMNVAREPLQHEACGKLLCKECLERYGKERPCPGCKRKSDYYIDKKSRRDIQALVVRCINVTRMCGWEGPVDSLDEHIQSCKYSLVVCPNECKDVADRLNYLEKKELSNHLRNDCPNRYAECDHCNRTGKKADLLIHEQTCTKKVVSCPDIACSKTIRRDEVDSHIKNDCLFAVVQCKFHGMGCSVKMKRKDIMRHEQDYELHFPMVLGTVSELKDNVSILRETLLELRTSVLDIVDNVVRLQESYKPEVPLQEEKTAPVTFPLTDYTAKRVTDNKFTSIPFYTSTYGYRLAVRVFANGDGDGRGTHVSLCAPILEGKYDSDLEWPFVGTITFTLLNQLEDRNHYSHRTTLKPEHKAVVGVDWGKPKFIQQAKLDYDKDRNTQYLKNDTLYFRVTADVAGHKPWLECATSRTMQGVSKLSC